MRGTALAQNINPELIMTRNILLQITALVLLAGCAPLPPNAPMNAAGNRYLDCLNARAEKNMDNPNG